MDDSNNTNSDVEITITDKQGEQLKTVALPLLARFGNYWRQLPRGLAVTLTVVFVVVAQAVIARITSLDIPDLRFYGFVVAGPMLLSLTITFIRYCISQAEAFLG